MIGENVSFPCMPFDCIQSCSQTADVPYSYSSPLLVFPHSNKTIDKLPNAKLYDGFAYDVSLLHPFSAKMNALAAKQGRRSSTTRSLRRNVSMVGMKGGNLTFLTEDESIHSAKSASAYRAKSNNNSQKGAPTSVHGTNVFGARDTKAMRSKSVAM